MFGVRHMITAAYHPQTNGQAESTNKVAKDRLRKLSNDQQTDWHTHLEAVQHSMNIGQRSGTRLTPYFVHHGFHPRMVTQMCPPEIEESIDYPEELDNDEVVRLSELRAEEMVSVHKKMMERIAEAQRRQKKDYARRLGKGVKSFLFQVDDIVEKRNMRRTTCKGDTLEPLWMGPYRVMKVAGQCVTLFDFRLKRES